MNKREILIQKAKDSGISWYKEVVDKILSGKIRDGDICYVAGTPYHDYGGYKAHTERGYIYKDGDFELLFSNLSHHRANQVILNYNLYRQGKIDPIVWNNYINNGYLTRRGLLAKYTPQQKRRMLGIARSHADYLGRETGDSRQDHYNRMRLRN